MLKVIMKDKAEKEKAKNKKKRAQNENEEDAPGIIHPPPPYDVASGVRVGQLIVALWWLEQEPRKVC